MNASTKKFLSLFVFTLFCKVGFPESLPNATSIIKKVNDAEDGIQVTRKVTMKMIDRRGKERTRKTISYRKYFGKDRKTVIFYTDPANVKDTAFLTYDYEGITKEDDQWLYLPALRKIRRISSKDRGDYFLGTDFTYEDIKKEGKISIDEYDFSMEGKDVVDGKMVVKITAVCKTEIIAEEVGHSKVIMWIDPEINIVRKSLFFDINGNRLKTIYVSDIRKVDGKWTRHLLRAENHKTGHQSIFRFDEVDYKSNIPDRVFLKSSLRRGL